MIKIEKVETFGWEAALRGMRNPKDSWSKSDTFFINGEISIGPNDLDLMKRLCKAGTEHRKYLRMVHIQMDLTCNHFWWAEFDTYKVGVTRNSRSKMHKIHVKPFEISDFSHEGIDEVGGSAYHSFVDMIETLEFLRNMFNDSQDKKYWRAMLELLPMGYNLKATVDFDYETALNIIRQRSGHKVVEWHEFVDELKKLPYMKELLDLEKR